MQGQLGNWAILELGIRKRTLLARGSELTTAEADGETRKRGCGVGETGKRNGLGRKHNNELGQGKSFHGVEQRQTNIFIID